MSAAQGGLKHASPLNHYNVLLFQRRVAGFLHLLNVYATCLHTKQHPQQQETAATFQAIKTEKGQTLCLQNDQHIELGLTATSQLILRQKNVAFYEGQS
jgi:hypothetical protein